MTSPFENPVCATPSASGNHEGTRGGADLPDGKKETPGSGELPLLPTITNFDGVTPGDVGADRTITQYQTTMSTKVGKP